MKEIMWINNAGYNKFISCFLFYSHLLKLDYFISNYKYAINKINKFENSKIYKYIYVYLV